MTPKEKAVELYEKMFYSIHIDGNQNYGNSADQCAIIAVNEILSVLDVYPKYQLKSYEKEQIEYWNEVKQEIEKL